mmetsp:Transcript_23521/g.48941  ORF Transcript_23521/g.48941 Transcript_23521/m.48941 type:complete len:427 (+) Transcript_23521:138-1418(+)
MPSADIPQTAAQSTVQATPTPSPPSPPLTVDPNRTDTTPPPAPPTPANAFEGPEKTLEVCFRASTGGTPPTPGLRSLPRRSLDELCSLASCTIISSASNAYLDAYVLSESSLFVYPYMLILKTCGTTTLLRVLKRLIEMVGPKGDGSGEKPLNLVLDWVGYSRKNLNWPERQHFPHQSWETEISYISQHSEFTSRLNGSAYTLGPITGDHWFVWVADRTIRSDIVGTDRVMNIMMFDIDPAVAEKFYTSRYRVGGDEEEDEDMREVGRRMTEEAGIRKLVPGAIVDQMAFEPCGYSMNAILYNSYSTMHVTPETSFSYASFETNQKLSSYHALISNVVRTFNPGRFVLTMMADEAGLDEIKDNPLTDRPAKDIIVPLGPLGTGRKTYSRKSLASIQVEDDCCCLMGNFVRGEERGDGEIRRAATYT